MGDAVDSSVRILVVDDEEAIRDVLTDFLGMEGYSIETASDGQRALELLSRGDFSLVLTDLKMPNMGGLELLKAIRQHTPDVATIVMTGFGTVETAIDAMKAGAYDYLLKPFKIDEVLLIVKRALEGQRMKNENLRLRETLSLYKVSEAIAMSLSLDEVIETVMSTALEEVRADQAVVLLNDGTGNYFVREDRKSPEYRPPGGLPSLQASEIQRYFEDDRPLRESGEAVLRFFRDDGEVEPKSLLVTRLRMRGTVLGFLCCVSYTKARAFDEGQRKLLAIMSNRAAASIENAKLFEDLKATFQQTIQGLAKTIDKMDTYTAGHSERVAAYAQILAIKMGLSEEEIEVVRQSALLHDIGKVGCVLNLNKPGKLTREEYALFKKHPGFGRDILEPITFLEPVVPGVYSHHERWDGHGYPEGLKAQGIPLVARIVAVADTYDAMTSDRAYRRALPHQTAVDEIHRCSGTQFDPDVAGEWKEAIENHRRDGNRTAGEEREEEERKSSEMLMLATGPDAPVTLGDAEPK